MKLRPPALDHLHHIHAIASISGIPKRNCWPENCSTSAKGREDGIRVRAVLARLPRTLNEDSHHNHPVDDTRIRARMEVKKVSEDEDHPRFRGLKDDHPHPHDVDARSPNVAHLRDSAHRITHPKLHGLHRADVTHLPVIETVFIQIFGRMLLAPDTRLVMTTATACMIVPKIRARASGENIPTSPSPTTPSVLVVNTPLPHPLQPRRSRSLETDRLPV